MKIYFWGDGRWVYEHELPEMAKLDPMFNEIELPADTDEHTIDCIIFNEVSK